MTCTPTATPWYFLRRECAVCKRSIGTKPCAPEQHGKVSHGYCRTCYAAALRELNLPTVTR